MFSKVVKKNWVLVLAGLVITLFLFVVSNREEQQAAGIPVLPTPVTGDDEVEASTDHTNQALFVIDVKGEVKRPGVYEIEAGARVNDVIKLAGGFTDQANQLTVNLAQKLDDEMTVIVPVVGEEAVLFEASESGGKVKMNTATQSEIETLPGIGPSKAQAIIQYREEHGLFIEVEDLLNISGIGAKTLENMRDSLQIP